MTCVLSPIGLIPWFSKTEGKYLRYFAASPFPLQGKTNACSRGSKKDFWRRSRGDLRQVKTYQVPIINSSPSHAIICHSPLIFLSPTSKTIFEKIAFLCPSSVRLLRLLFVCSCVGLLALSQCLLQKMLTPTLGG